MVYYFMNAAVQQTIKRIHPLPKESLTEMEMIKRKMERLNAEMRTSGRKWLTAEEALGEYAKNIRKNK